MPGALMAENSRRGKEEENKYVPTE